MARGFKLGKQQLIWAGLGAAVGIIGYLILKPGVQEPLLGFEGEDYYGGQGEEYESGLFVAYDDGFTVGNRILVS